MGALVINGQKVAGVNIEIKPDIYSTEEREIGVWIDGKPLYQKTVIKDSNFVSGSNQIAHNISNIEKIISDESTLYYNNGDCVPLPAITLSSSGWTAKTRDFGDTYFYLDLGGDMLAYVASASFTLLYTKTTDQAGAGTWTPDGACAHHYSTDEKVVGTWIDGKTLYERTFTGLSVPTNGINWVHISAIDTTDWGEVIDCKIYRDNNNKYASIPIAEYTGYVSGISDLAISVISSDFNATITMAIVQYTKSS